MKTLSYLDFLKEADIEDTAVRVVLQRYPDFVGLVLFRNEMFDSSQFGAKSVMPVGPSNTFKSLEDCEGKWLYDLPSQRQYPIVGCKKEDIT